MIITSTVGRSLKIGLHFLGMWPDVPYSGVYWSIFMSGLLIVQYFQYQYIFAHFKISELSNLVDGLSVTLDYSLTFFKLCSLWIRRRVLHEILAAMDDDWRACMGIDQHLYVMTVKANLAHFYSNAVLGFTAIAGVVYFSSDYIIRSAYVSDDYNDTLRQLPVKVKLPFDIERTPIFELLVVTLFVHGILHVYVVAILNGLIFTLVIHASGQIDIICQEFKTISEKIVARKSSMSMLGKLVKRHKRIISFINKIENIFSFVALMQVVWNTLVICCLGFVIIISVHNGASIFLLMKIIMAYVAIMMEAFVFCFAGEYLSLKSKSIADAAYETLWYDMPSNQTKIITFIIMRSQKRLTITAGKMMDMSFGTFTSIMKASASYISVLHAMY